MKILSSSQIRASEAAAVKSGRSYGELMLTAGARVAQVIGENISVSGKKICVVCGRGNNGGDGIVAASRLCQMGAQTSVYFPLGKPQSEPAMRFVSKLENIEVISELPQECDVLVDALFGIGFNRVLSENMCGLIESMNLISAYKVAVDVPSGIMCDSGVVAKAFRADLTVTFIAFKPCFFLPPAFEYCGKAVVADIGVNAIDYTYLTNRKPPKYQRRINTHKGDYGTALMICGSYGMCGAAILSATAALRSGVGIVKSLLCDKNYVAFCGSVPEAVTIPVPTSALGAPIADDAVVSSAISGSDAILIGCGLGNNADSSRLVKRTLSLAKIPVVIDADGINAISSDINILGTVKAPVILTPHSAEMARLCKVDAKDIERNRVGFAEKIARKYSCVVVLKGARTIIASPDGRIFFNMTGNAGMAVGGSGDVLSGMIVSRLAQGEGALSAALSAVWLHGAAGDAAAERFSKRSLLPRDIIEELKYMPE